MPAVIVLLALVGFAALGRLVAHWLAWAEEIQDETEFVDEMRAAPPPKQEPDLYH
jgi:hypothetical protein